MKKFENRLSEKVKKLYRQHEDILEEMERSVYNELMTLLNATILLEEFSVEININGEISDIRMQFEDNTLTEDEFKNYSDHVYRGIFSLLVPLTGHTLLLILEEKTLVVCNQDGIKTYYSDNKKKLDLYEEFYGQKETN